MPERVFAILLALLLPGDAARYWAANPYTGIFRHGLETGTETPILEGIWEYITLLNLR